jgi:predicted RNase H-like HicB family nuclease
LIALVLEKNIERGHRAVALGNVLLHLRSERALEKQIEIKHSNAMKTNLRLKLTAVFEAAPEGGFTCYFEEFPDVFSEGETIESAKENLHDALQLVLEYHRDEARKKENPSVVRQEMELSGF